MIEVEVAAREHNGDPRLGRQLHQPVEQCGDGRGCGAFDDQLATFHHPEHRVEDLAIRQRDDVVHESLDNREVDRADAPDVDGVVYVTGKRLSAGKIVPCEVVGRSDYDLVAAAVGEPR